MSANVSSILPKTIPVERTVAFQDEWANRFGVMMGGPKVVDWPGIGQFWVGHAEFPRRELRAFTRQQVRTRNESEDVLDDPNGTLLGPSALDKKRLWDKSPSACMREVIASYGGRGYVSSRVLMQIADVVEAERVFNLVMPVEIRALPLVDVIEYLAKSEPLDNAQTLSGEMKAKAHALREELLQGGYVAREYMTLYTNAVSEEIGMAGEKKTGKRAPDLLDREYFWELKKPLPEERPAIATIALGKEIASAVSGDSDTKQMLVQLVEQNRLQAESNRILQEQLARKSEGSPSTKKRGRPAKQKEIADNGN